MNMKQEAVFSSIAAALLLLTALLDPLISTTLAIILLIAFSIYKYIQSKKHSLRVHDIYDNQ